MAFGIDDFKSVAANPTTLSYALIACTSLILGYYTMYDQNGPVSEQREEPVSDQREEPVSDQREEPVSEQREEPVSEQREEPVPEQREEPVPEPVPEQKEPEPTIPSMGGKKKKSRRHRKRTNRSAKQRK